MTQPPSAPQAPLHAPLHAKKLLVIITEAVLEKQLTLLAREAGAHGYTVHDVRGAGQHEQRDGSWEADRSIEFKVICSPEVAEQLADQVMERYAAHYGLTVFFADVAVRRPGKY